MKMKTTFSLSLLTAGLLTGTALVNPQIASAATTDLQAQTGWAISRVASVSRGSYCAMAQKFSNNTVMTIAKNDKSEYSLAFDFQAPKFALDKEVTASVKAGAGAAQTFAVRPQSPQAVVLTMGSDEGFMNDLKSSGKVVLDVEGESYTFNTEKFADAQGEMATCMSSMKVQTREAKAAPQTAAEEEAKEKVASAPAPSPTALSAEDLVAAPVDEPAAPENQYLKSENAQLKQAMADTRKSYEDEMSSRSGPAVPELQEKVRALELENARLKSESAKVTASAQTKQDLAKATADLDKAKADLAQAAAQNKAMQDKLAAAALATEEQAKIAQSLQLTKREADTLKAENQTLKNQLQISAGADSKAVTAQAEQLTKLQQENTALKADLEKSAKGAAADPVAEQELTYLRAENEKLVKELAAAQRDDGATPDAQKQLSSLQAENENLRDRLAQATITPMPAEDKAAPLTPGDSETLREQMRDLRSQLELAESENAGLKKQIDNLQKDSEGSQLKMAGGSWDLEQATRRYQESQREIRRLGALLEQDRVKCNEEKKNIEYMLFDPEVAKPAQISMLGSLEDQIAQKDARISDLEQSLKSAGLQPAAGNSQSAVSGKKSAEIAPEQLLAANVTDTAPVAAAPRAPATADVEAMALPVPSGNKALAPASVAGKAPAAMQAAPLQPQDVAVMQPPVAPSQPVTAAPLASTPVAANGVQFQSPQDFATLLKAAGVGIRGSVQPVQKASSSSYKAYSWQTDSLYGSAEQKEMADSGAFEPAVQQYLDRAKSRCKGDFAAVPAQLKSSGAKNEGYEIACVSGQSGSSASVLFSYNNGVMTTVAHEGRAEAMDIAMDARDRVAAHILSN